MIVRYDGDRELMDCEALSVALGLRSPATIRKHCTPARTDPATGRQLFDVELAVSALRDIKSRAPHRRRRI
ncbi:hypothetical protein [Catelliglobosispora koreensis]|uniref:hypothetical protein n=1 Tax=Catelliglobosispora koreensis TaxID=129052 RepID=UPI00036ABC28|nr:hypothetical protein [Catelliglobosispora koreensis]